MENFLKAAYGDKYHRYAGDHDEESASPDSAVSSMLLAAQKKDKTCLVCGDKALGYNFNAVSCESCKAFFRRNAHKTIRGRCEGKCDVNIESRSFCKRCRLQKCFTVGMRKDMILDDEQKLLRKQKILINRLKRHGTLPPEDTYAVSEQDLKHTYTEKFTSQSVESLRLEYPNLSDEDIATLRNIKKEKGVGGDEGCGGGKGESKLNKYPAWSDVKDNLEQIIWGMDPVDKQLILEMNKAHESSAFLSNTFTRLKNLPSTPTEVFNIADGFVRRIIKVAKQLTYFRAIDKDDQIAMLKGSVVEIMMLRSAVNFDVKTETWNLSTTSCIKPDGSEAGGGSPMAGLDINALRKAAMAGADFDTLRKMAMGGSTETAGAGREAAEKGQEHSGAPQQPHGNLDAMRNMAHAAPDTTERMRVEPPAGMANLDHLRNMAKNSGLDVDALRKAAMGGASFDQPSTGINLSLGVGNLDKFRNMANSAGFGDKMSTNPAASMGNVEHLRNMAKSSGLDVDALRKAAMGGASFDQLSQMARGGVGGGNTGGLAGTPAPPVASPPPQTDVPTPPEQKPQQGTSISAEILKLGNPETKTMFLTYSKFIRSLMSTIYGDLIVLKFLIMLSLFSPDRQGITNRRVIEQYQEKYAVSLQKYIETRFHEEKNMFARCIMKLTDLRNVNEVHTKMLLKMQVDDIEPLLIEIFDLPS